jgi:hypothetical protein
MARLMFVVLIVLGFSGCAVLNDLPPVPCEMLDGIFSCNTP